MEVEFIPSGKTLKETFIAEYNFRVGVEKILCSLEEEIRLYVGNGDEVVEALKLKYWYFEWGGEWFIPIMRKEVNRVKVKVQMFAKAEHKQERRLMGCR